jgi:hypothetical protein
VRARVVAGAVLGVLLAAAGGLTAARAGEALPGAAVEGTHVGGLDRGQVRAAVERLADERTAGELPVVAREVRAALPRDLVQVDVDATVDAVMDDGGSPLTTLLRRGAEVELRTTADFDRLDDRLEQLADDVDREPFTGALVVQGLTSLRGRRPRDARSTPTPAPTWWRPRSRRGRRGRSSCRSPTSRPRPLPPRWRRSPRRPAPRSPGRTCWALRP